jgi:hypothetical protein
MRVRYPGVTGKTAMPGSFDRDAGVKLAKATVNSVTSAQPPVSTKSTQKPPRMIRLYVRAGRLSISYAERPSCISDYPHTAALVVSADQLTTSAAAASNISLRHQRSLFLGRNQ